ncbi:uncharacterized protein LOC143660018 [Tamandua tetradactyla]|uniref:uncharacterized protein LOC143660018 n=1 Tax=Tamandua tetradactyla TaxID=48850 RepID=UPI0040542CEE
MGPGSKVKSERRLRGSRGGRGGEYPAPAFSEGFSLAFRTPSGRVDAFGGDAAPQRHGDRCASDGRAQTSPRPVQTRPPGLPWGRLEARAPEAARYGGCPSLEAAGATQGAGPPPPREGPTAAAALCSAPLGCTVIRTTVSVYSALPGAPLYATPHSRTRTRVGPRKRRSQVREHVFTAHARGAGPSAGAPGKPRVEERSPARSKRTAGTGSARGGVAVGADPQGVCNYVTFTLCSRREGPPSQASNFFLEREVRGKRQKDDLHASPGHSSLWSEGSCCWSLMLCHLNTVISKFVIVLAAGTLPSDALGAPSFFIHHSILATSSALQPMVEEADLSGCGRILCRGTRRRKSSSWWPWARDSGALDWGRRGAGNQTRVSGMAGETLPETPWAAQRLCYKMRHCSRGEDPLQTEMEGFIGEKKDHKATVLSG